MKPSGTKRHEIEVISYDFQYTILTAASLPRISAQADCFSSCFYLCRKQQSATNANAPPNKKTPIAVGSPSRPQYSKAFYDFNFIIEDLSQTYLSSFLQR
jgi:hypothetical protein